MSKQLRADLLLILVTICWGASFYLVDISLSELGPLTLLAFRFGVAFIVVFLFFYNKSINVSKTTLKYAFSAGVFLALTYYMSVIGVANTSVTNASFLCAMSVVFTPIIAFFAKGNIPSKKFILVVILCTIGMALLTLGDTIEIVIGNIFYSVLNIGTFTDNSIKFAIGDLYSLFCAVAFSINIILTESAVKNEDVNPFQLGVYMLFVVGLIMSILAFIFEKPTLPQSKEIWFAMLFLAFICTAAATILQAIAQKDTSASHVGIIYTLEPIFASIIAYIFAGEVLSFKGYLGAGIMILSILLLEIDFSKVLKINRN